MAELIHDVISSSPGDLQPVFQAMMENAVRICEAKFGTLFLYENGVMRAVALHNAPPPYAEARRREPERRPQPGSSLARIISTRRVVHIADIATEPGIRPHLLKDLNHSGGRQRDPILADVSERIVSEGLRLIGGVE